MESDSWFPSWLPVDGFPWRLVNNRTGAFYKHKPNLRSRAFETDDDAIAFAKSNGLPLAAGLDKPGSGD